MRRCWGNEALFETFWKNQVHLRLTLFILDLGNTSKALWTKRPTYSRLRMYHVIMFYEGWHHGTFYLKKEKKGKTYFSRRLQHYSSNSVKLCAFSPFSIVYHLYAHCFCPQQETPSSSYLLILLFSPGSFYQFRVEHLLPAVLALAICPSLKHGHTTHHTRTTAHLSPLPAPCAAVRTIECKLNQIRTGNW